MMTNINELHDLAELMGFRIVAPGARHNYDAAMEEKPNPKWVLRKIKPGYDIAMYWSSADLKHDLDVEYESFCKFNADIAARAGQRGTE